MKSISWASSRYGKLGYDLNYGFIGTSSKVIRYPRDYRLIKIHFACSNHVAKTGLEETIMQVPIMLKKDKERRLNCFMTLFFHVSNDNFRTFPRNAVVVLSFQYFCSTFLILLWWIGFTETRVIIRTRPSFTRLQLTSMFFLFVLPSNVIKILCHSPAWRFGVFFEGRALTGFS